MATHSSTLAWKNHMVGEAWQATVHGVAKSWTQLSDFTFSFKEGRKEGEDYRKKYEREINVLKSIWIKRTGQGERISILNPMSILGNPIKLLCFLETVKPGVAELSSSSMEATKSI